jgi:two-component system response regulator YesN
MSDRILLVDKEALRKLPVWKPNLVITDLCMPEMDGMELLGEIRKMFPNMDVIMIFVFQ